MELWQSTLIVFKLAQPSRFQGFRIVSVNPWLLALTAVCRPILFLRFSLAANPAAVYFPRHGVGNRGVSELPHA
jgi:hypothetical protein